MTREELYRRITATRRSQRITLLVALAPFYLAFTLGWMTRTPIALFVGAIGLVIGVGIYRRFATKNPPPPPAPPREIIIHAAGDEE